MTVHFWLRQCKNY